MTEKTIAESAAVPDITDAMCAAAVAEFYRKGKGLAPASPMTRARRVLAAALAAQPRAQASAPPVSVPEGWWLAPEEPTDEMRRAGFISASNGFGVSSPADAPDLVYSAMRAVAPTPPSHFGEPAEMVSGGYRRDAERYRWLRERAWFVDEASRIYLEHEPWTEAPRPDWDEVEQAIDTAMASEGGK